MKIAIVCGHFIPQMGFVEVYLAKEFAKLHHEVKVFTSTVVPKYVRGIVKNEAFNVGVTKHEEFNYTILRLKPIVSFGQMLYVKRLRKEIDQFSPELVIVIGVGKLFPEAIYTENKAYKLLTLLGDSSDNYQSDKSKIVDKVKNKLKQRIYQKSITHSDKLLPYTPETIDLVKDIVAQQYYAELESKSEQITLGFDKDYFNYSPKLRIETRAELKLTEDATTLITATRIVPFKKLEKVIDWVEDMNTNGNQLHYIIIGFLENDYASEVKNYINKKVHKDKFHCYPFLDYTALNKLYMAADIAFYPTAAISIFEAIATGLLAVLPDKRNIGHIVDDKETGWYIKENRIEETFQKAFDAVNNPKFNREKIVMINEKKYSFENIAKRVLKLSRLN